jgi:tetratricopeptide (TPR) repeat protein
VVPLHTRFANLFPVSLVIVGALTYANSTAGPFVFDDIPSIVDNRAIRSFWPLTGIFTAPDNSIAQGRPLIQLSLTLNYAFGGLSVRGYHIYNIAVHLLATLVLYDLVRRTLMIESLRERFGSHAPLLAWVCALLWMLHPIQSESVNYISQRTETTMGLFYLMTLYSAMRAMEGGQSRPWYVASVVCCAAGMASKEVMATAPLMVLLYEVTIRKAGVGEALRRRRSLYLGLASTWLILAALLWAYPDIAIGFRGKVSAWTYLLNQCAVVVDYIRLVFWPHPLALDYGTPRLLEIGDVLSRALFLLGLFGATVALLIRQPQCGFLLAWFFIVLAPTSSVVPIAEEVGAERRMYLALAGPLVLGVLLAYRGIGMVAARLQHSSRKTNFWSSASFVQRSGMAAVLLLAATYAYVTASRNLEYRDALSIWRTAVLAIPDNPRAHSNLGVEAQRQNRLGMAVRSYRQALALDPEYVSALTNLGVALTSLNKPDEGIAALRQALRHDPDNVKAHYNLGVALSSRNQNDEAIEAFRRAVELRPDYVDAYNNLGGVLTMLRRHREALPYLREAVRLAPDNVSAWYNLGMALESVGDFEEASEALATVVHLAPQDVEARIRLGDLLARRGRWSEAAVHYAVWSRTQPRNADAHFQLGMALERSGERERAEESLREALRLQPNYPEARRALSATRKE